MVVELKGTGIARISYIGKNRQVVQDVTKRMALSFIKNTFLPFKGVGQKIKAHLVRKDDLLNLQLRPSLEKVRICYQELSKNFYETSPNLLSAKYEYFAWREKVLQREKKVMQRATYILPLFNDEPDSKKLANIIKVANYPSETR